jgi:AraC-like DNA-binding protein
MVSCPPRWAQIERGAFSSSLQSVRLGRVRAFHDRVSVGAQYQGILEPGTVLLAMKANAETHARWSGMPVTQDDIAVARRRVDVCCTGAGDILSLHLDHEIAAELGVLPASDDAFLLRNPSVAPRLRSQLNLLFVDGPLPRDRRGNEEAIEALLSQASSSRRILPGALTPRFLAVRACEAYMRDHIDESISLHDLSEACGFRPRSLINAFEAFTGVSPMAYLKALRLNGVREALGAAGRGRTRIIDVAMDWGFEHMGHFAADYRAMFGERPSETPRARELAIR